MDNKPLKESTKILVQVGTTERPLGWKTKPISFDDRAGEQIESFGHAPWMIVRADVEITIANPALKTAQVLDVNGMPRNAIPLNGPDGRKTFKFPPDALYVVLQ
jgi:hypothetical protein